MDCIAHTVLSSVIHNPRISNNIFIPKTYEYVVSCIAFSQKRSNFAYSVHFTHREAMRNLFTILRNEGKPKKFGGLDIIRNIGPGLLVTVGFIDPGNWASNFAAGSEYGYTLLWVVTLSTIMPIALQHNVAHLGIVTGLCLSEATQKYTPK